MPSISFIDRDKVVMTLIKERCKLADKQAEINQHEEFLSRQCVKTKGNRYLERDIYKMFPPRREWCSLGKRRQQLDSVKRNEYRLKYTYLQAKRVKCEENWYLKLCEYADKVVKMANTQTGSIPPPKVAVIEKKMDANDKKVHYRPICTFPSEIKIVLSLLNKFLSRILDDYFFDCSYAFRTKKMGFKLQHLNAVNAVREYRKKHECDALYVAECDMKKFYDTISHDLIKERFSILLGRAVRDGKILSYEARVVKNWVYMYVDCFDFRKNVHMNNQKPSTDKFWNLHVKDAASWKCQIDWVDELSKIKGNKIRGKVGVPQGGALSGLIANIVMHNVDKVVLRNIGEEDILYCRFCDDMIMVGTDKEKISAVFKAYERAIHSSKLFSHSNMMSVKRASDFWDGKTRGPYEWGIKGKDTYPWITFVGFDINWRGDMRIRKPSFKKHLKKQYEIANELLLPYTKGQRPRYSADTIMSSLYSRLICMSIGRVNLWNYKHFDNKCSWMSAFSILDENPWSVSQMKRLDGHRNAILKRAREVLTKLDCPAVKKKDNSHQSGEGGCYNFYGSPYSYYGQCFVYK